MQYGRTALEAILAQALILGAIIVVPFDLIDALGPVATSLLAMTIAAVTGTALYLRHRGRVSAGFSRKLEALRNVPVA